MSRKVVVKVEDYAPLQPGQAYRLIVFHIERKARGQCIEAALRNVEPEHDGRVHRVVLPLPVRPAGRSAEFFRAVGQEVAVDKSIALRDAVGKAVLGFFGPSANGDLEIMSFRPVSKEAQDAAEPE